MNSKQKGEVSELIVISHLMKLGKSVSKPFGDSQRYDIIVDENGILFKVQVKTGKLKNGIIFANACRHPVGTSKRISYKSSEIDVIIIYCPDTNGIYWIPFKEIENLVTVTLRVDLPKNNQSKKIKWATDYLI